MQFFNYCPDGTVSIELCTFVACPPSPQLADSSASGGCLYLKTVHGNKLAFVNLTAHTPQSGDSSAIHLEGAEATDCAYMTISRCTGSSVVYHQSADPVSIEYANFVGNSPATGVVATQATGFHLAHCYFQGNTPEGSELAQVYGSGSFAVTDGFFDGDLPPLADANNEHNAVFTTLPIPALNAGLCVAAAAVPMPSETPPLSETPAATQATSTPLPTPLATPAASATSAFDASDRLSASAEFPPSPSQVFTDPVLQPRLRHSRFLRFFLFVVPYHD
jgi:hypothetical protein